MMGAAEFGAGLEFLRDVNVGTDRQMDDHVTGHMTEHTPDWSGCSFLRAAASILHKKDTQKKIYIYILDTKNTNQLLL